MRHRLVLTTSAAVAFSLVASTVVAPAAFAKADPEQNIIVSLDSQPVQSGIGLASRLVATVDAHAAIAANIPARSNARPLGLNFTIDVTDVETNKPIYEREPSKPMLPASNMKIITAINALNEIGPDTRYTTTVYSMGPGAVVIQGTGDATLSPTAVKDMARTTSEVIKATPELTPPQPKKIQVYVDTSAYPDSAPPKGWLPGYAPTVERPPSALAMDGRYVLDPAADVAKTFGKAMTMGLKGRYAGHSTVQPDQVKLASSTGATVYDQVRYMLQVSENNVAESLFRNVAIATGRPGTWKGAREAALASIASIGVPTQGFRTTTGSGVGRNDRLTAVGLVEALRIAANQTQNPQLKAIYYGGGMPKAGVNGTLAASTGRYTKGKARCAAGRILAKTGTLHDVVALSGLGLGADGELKAFSILVNDRPERKFSPLKTRRKVDEIAAAVVGC